MDQPIYGKPLINQPKTPVNSYPLNNSPYGNIQPTYQNINNPILVNQSPIINPPAPVVVPSYDYIPPPSEVPSSLELAELFEDLENVNEVQVLKYFQGGFLRIGEKQKYKVRINCAKNSTRDIFICQRNYSILHGDNYNFEVRMKYIPRDSTEEIMKTKDFNKRLFDIDSREMQGFKPKIFIKNMDNNIAIGTVQQRRCCTCCCRDPFFEIYTRHAPNVSKYFITTDGCRCSYCCCPECCCAQGDTDFHIFDSFSRLYVGSIIKLAFDNIKQDYLVYNITFPQMATNEDKMLFICTAIAFDNINYRNLGNNV